MTDSDGQITGGGDTAPETNTEDLTLEEIEDGEREAFKAELMSRITANSDGSLILRLFKPIDWKGRPLEKVTMRRINVGAMRKVVGTTGEYNALDMACVLTVPAGAGDELESEGDLNLLVMAVQTQQGKYQAASEASGSN
jgi:hypothetical protein